MNSVYKKCLPAICMVICSTQLNAQEPQARPGNRQADQAMPPLVSRMLAFDKNGDGMLTRDEITDERLLRLFVRADANKDGIVTKEELQTLAKAMQAEIGQGGGRGGFGGPPDGGPGRRGPGGDFGGPPGGGRRGRGPGGDEPPRGQPGMRGPGGFGGPPQPGQILPSFLQERLNLSSQQKSQLQDLQKDVDAKLGKILTDEQKNQLKDMRNEFFPPDGGGRGRRGPGGRGGDGGGPGQSH